MKKLMIALAAVAAAVAASGAAAKLPPPSPEAQAKAEETKAKAAWSDKVAAYKLCLVQDKVAAAYHKSKGAEGKQDSAQATPAVPPCQDPGPYVAQAPASGQVGVADSKPVPAAGAGQPAPAESKK